MRNVSNVCQLLRQICLPRVFHTIRILASFPISDKLKNQKADDAMMRFIKKSAHLHPLVRSVKFVGNFSDPVNIAIPTCDYARSFVLFLRWLNSEANTKCRPQKLYVSHLDVDPECSSLIRSSESLRELSFDTCQFGSRSVYKKSKDRTQPPKPRTPISTTVNSSLAASIAPQSLFHSVSTSPSAQPSRIIRLRVGKSISENCIENFLESIESSVEFIHFEEGRGMPHAHASGNKVLECAGWLGIIIANKAANLTEAELITRRSDTIVRLRRNLTGEEVVEGGWTLVERLGMGNRSEWFGRLEHLPMATRPPTEVERAIAERAAQGRRR